MDELLKTAKFGDLLEDHNWMTDDSIAGRPINSSSWYHFFSGTMLYGEGSFLRGNYLKICCSKFVLFSRAPNCRVYNLL